MDEENQFGLPSSSSGRLGQRMASSLFALAVSRCLVSCGVGSGVGSGVSLEDEVMIMGGRTCEKGSLTSPNHDVDYT